MTTEPILADLMDPTIDTDIVGQVIEAGSPKSAIPGQASDTPVMDETTRKIIVGMSNFCKDSLEFSTICDPSDSPSKLATLIANCLDFSPAAFNPEIKGRTAVFKVSTDCIPLVVSKFFFKASVISDDHLGEYLEARIDTPEGKYYKFRISDNHGGIKNIHKFDNKNTGYRKPRGGGGGRGRGRAGGRGRGGGGGHGRGDKSPTK